MAYALRYIMQFFSDRGNEIRIEIRQKGYVGEVEYKSLGSAPVLAIEEGDGAIKGSSLSFAIQADVEDELKSLYTTDNKLFKVDLYRNSSLYWQGYLLPELYSENYIDPPYDVSVTAIDGIATLKNVVYQEDDIEMSLLDIIKNLLGKTMLVMPCKIHMQLYTMQGIMLTTAYISAAAYNGQTCYDVLNAILLSCNCKVLQFANEWLITAVTNAETSYHVDGNNVDIPHCLLGQMGTADVYPDGSLGMVNAPALKGVTVEYNHTLRNSMLKNANCVNREGWSYVPGGVEDRFPGEIDMGDAVYKCYFWLLKQKNLKNDNSLQIWQGLDLEHDVDNAYKLSFKYLFMSEADLLLLSVLYRTDEGEDLYLTASGWNQNLDRYNVNSYIQVTGNNGNSNSVYTMADRSNYQEASVLFMLPNKPGALRIGFINCTSDYSDPFFTRTILVTDVYLSVSNVAGKVSTTVVEPNATSEQEEISIVYGEPISSVNAKALDMTYLKYENGETVKNIILAGKEYSSYYEAIVQELSRYYGVKKMQLQGTLAGQDVLHPLYVDTFSSKVLRLVSGQYDLLHDTISVSIEEVPFSFVDYDLVVYAQENNPNKNTTTNSGTTVVGGGGESLLGIQSDGDVFVKNNRAITGIEAKFAALALPNAKPLSTSEEKTYIYSSEPATYPAIDIAKVIIDISKNATAITAVSNRVQKFEDVIGIDDNGDVYIKGTRNFYTERGTIGMAGLGSGGGGGTAGLGSVTVRVNGEDYTTDESGIVTIPDYPTSLPALDVYHWAKKSSLAIADVPDLSSKYIPITGGTVVKGALSPSTTKAYNLGGLSNQWKNLFLGGEFRVYNSDNTADFLANWNESTFQMYAYESVYYDMVIGTSLAAIATYNGLYYNATSKAWGIGTKTPAYTLDVKGGLNATTIYHNGVALGSLAVKNSLLASDIPSLDWSKITSGKPTTLEGYGITDLGSYNAASATKLQTARTIWGQSFNGTDNITGALKLGYGTIFRNDDNGNEQTLISFSTGNTLFNYGLAGQGNNLYLDGNNVRLRHGTSHTTGLLLNSAGNVLIGTTTDNGGKLQVGGTTHITIAPTSNADINFLTLKYNASWSSYPNALGGISVTDGNNGIVGKFGITYSGGVGRFVVKGLFNGSYDGSGEVLKVAATGDTSIGRNLNVGGQTTTNSLKIGSATLSWDEANKALKINTNVYSDGTIAMGELGEGGSGTGGATGIVTIRVNGADYTSSNGIVTLPNYPTVPTALKSPYALTFGSKTYDGSVAKTILASDLGALTAHQTIYALTINNSAGTAQVTYTPNSKAASLTLTKAMVGLGNVENTALSTWIGSSKITTLGTITTGVWNGSKIANAYLANSSMTIAETSVSLGGSITAATLKSNLGLGSLAYKSSLAASDIPSLDWSKITTGKPTTLAGYGITDALSTSGGTIKGLLNIYRNNAGIRFFSTDGTTSLGWLGFSGDKTPIIWDRLGLESFRLYHTGNFNPANYLSLSGGTMANNAGIKWSYNVHSWNAPADGFEAISTTNDNLGYYAGISYKGYYGLQIRSYGGATDNIQVRGYNSANWGSWVNLIHSGNIGSQSVASATKLQTARIIFGRAFDGTTDVSGNLYITNHNFIRCYDTQGNYSNVLGINNNNILMIGYESATREYSTYIYGNEIVLSYGASHKRGLTLNSAGNVLIGTTTDSGARLQVNGNIAITDTTGSSATSNRLIFVRNTRTDDYWDYGLYAQSTKGLTFFQSSKGVNTDIANLDGYGNLTVTGGATFGGDIWTEGTMAMAKLASSSDRKLKANIAEVTAEQSMGIIRQLRPTTWNWKKDGKKSYGLIAQEVAPIVPEMVVDMGHLHLEYNQLHAFELGAIKYLDVKVETQEQKIERLENKVNELENELKQYRQWQ